MLEKNQNGVEQAKTRLLPNPEQHITQDSIAFREYK